MPLNPADLANDLKAALSNSPDPTLQGLTDAFYDTLATCITDQILRAEVTVDGNAGTFPVT